VDIKNTIGVEESCIIKCPLTVAATVEQCTSIVVGSFFLISEWLTKNAAVFKSVEW
jgi:hypothetical protein